MLDNCEPEMVKVDIDFVAPRPLNRTNVLGADFQVGRLALSNLYTVSLIYNERAQAA